jgi:hypothetical protein
MKKIIGVVIILLTIVSAGNVQAETINYESPQLSEHNHHGHRGRRGMRLFHRHRHHHNKDEFKGREHSHHNRKH